MLFRQLAAITFLLLLTIGSIFAQDNDLDKLMEKYDAKQAVFTIESNDDLEQGQFSVRFESPEGSNVSQQVDNFVMNKMTKKQYRPMSFVEAVNKFTSSRKDKDAEQKNIVLVTKAMKNGEVSPDDIRFASYLESTRKVKVIIFLLPDEKSDAGAKQLVVSGEDYKEITDESIKEQALQDAENLKVDPVIEDETGTKTSFWKEQWKRFRGIPARPNWTAFNVSLWRTGINVAAATALFLYQSDVITPERFVAYVGTGVFFSMFFGIINQTILNWIDFWMGFTEEGMKRLVKLDKLKNWVNKNIGIIKKNRNFTESTMDLGERAGLLKKTKVFSGKVVYEVARFISRRGDVLIAYPVIGVATTFFVRYALGEVGQTASVMTATGFAILVGNIIWGSIFGGPINQTLLYLKSQGRMSSKQVLKLSALEELKMQFGKVGDFGFQTLFYVGQSIIGTTLWAALWTTELLFPKPQVVKLSPEESKDIRDIRDDLRDRYYGSSDAPRPENGGDGDGKSPAGGAMMPPADNEVKGTGYEIPTMDDYIKKGIGQADLNRILDSDFVEQELLKAKTYKDIAMVEVFMDMLLSDGFEYTDEQFKKLSELGEKLEDTKELISSAMDADIAEADIKAIVMRYLGLEQYRDMSDREVTARLLEKMSQDTQNNNGLFSTDVLSVFSRAGVLELMLEGATGDAKMYRLVSLCEGLLEPDNGKYRMDYYLKPEFESIRKELRSFRYRLK